MGMDVPDFRERKMENWTKTGKMLNLSGEF